MTTRPLFAAALAALPLAACAPAMEREQDIRAPAITVAGQPQSCITLNQLDRTEVHDDYTIDFVMDNGTRYRNSLPNRCYSLGFEERFAYQTSTGRLCSSDTIQVLHGEGQSGTSCGLGEFLPVTLAAN